MRMESGEKIEGLIWV